MSSALWRTIKESCLDRLILVGEDSLRRAMSEFMTHYHHERNQQELGNLLLFPCLKEHRREMPITCRPRFGWMLKYYHRQAAEATRESTGAPAKADTIESHPLARPSG